MVTDTRETIGQRLKRHRKDRGLSQIDLAEGICSSSTISLLETDQHVPAAGIMQQLAEKLGMTMHELVEGQAEVLDLSLQLDVIEILVETEDYAAALPMIHQLEKCEELVEYQRRNLTLNLAECYMRTGEPNQAVELLSEMRQTLEQHREPDTRLMATLYNKLGNAYYLASNMAHAHANYLRAYQITLQFPEFDLLSAQISYNLASACRWCGLYAESILHFRNAYDFFHATSNRRRLANVIMSLGLTYKNMGEFQIAKNLMQQSLSLYQAENMLMMARNARMQYAFYVLGQEDTQIAISELEECAKQYGEVGENALQAYTYARIASLLLDQKQVENAGVVIEQAIKLFTEEEASSDPKYPYVYRVYASYLLKKKQYDLAIEFSYRSQEIFSRMALEKEAADSLNIANIAYRKQDCQKGVIETLERANEVLLRGYEKPFQRPTGELW